MTKGFAWSLLRGDGTVCLILLCGADGAFGGERHLGGVHGSDGTGDKEGM